MTINERATEDAATEDAATEDAATEDAAGEDSAIGDAATGETSVLGDAVGEQEEDEPLLSLTEQMAEQLGGWRGLVESSIPVAVFVLANVVTELRPALIASVSVGVLIAVMRLIQRRPIRHAINGLFGIAIGAVIAWRTGQEENFYLPGIIYGLVYGMALLVSVAVRRPLVGWIWSVVVAGGRSAWRQDPRLVRAFSWLTVLWGVVWLAKVGVQAALYLAHMETALGVARLVLGYPPYALLLAITVWTVRRVTHSAEPVPTA